MGFISPQPAGVTPGFALLSPARTTPVTRGTGTGPSCPHTSGTRTPTGPGHSSWRTRVMPITQVGVRAPGGDPPLPPFTSVTPSLLPHPSPFSISNLLACPCHLPGPGQSLFFAGLCIFEGQHTGGGHSSPSELPAPHPPAHKIPNPGGWEHSCHQHRAMSLLVPRSAHQCHPAPPRHQRGHEEPALRGRRHMPEEGHTGSVRGQVPGQEGTVPLALVALQPA